MFVPFEKILIHLTLYDQQVFLQYLWEYLERLEQEKDQYKLYEFMAAVDCIMYRPIKLICNYFNININDTFLKNEKSGMNA